MKPTALPQGSKNKGKRKMPKKQRKQKTPTNIITPTVTVSLEDYMRMWALTARAEELLADAKQIVGECEQFQDVLSYAMLAAKNHLRASIQSFESVWREIHA